LFSFVKHSATKRFYIFFYVLLTAHPCKILQIYQTRYTIRLVYLFLFSTCFGHPCAHHLWEYYCIYAKLVFVTLYGWSLVCWLEWNMQRREIN